MMREAPECPFQDQPTPAQGRGLRILQAFLNQPTLTPEERRKHDRFLRENRRFPMRLLKESSYVLISLSFWLIVEWITVWRTRFDEWMSLMPWAFLQYLAIVLVFWFILFNRRWTQLKSFIAMTLVMYTFEFLWKNPLLSNIALFIPTSVLLIQIWGFLTFVPAWIVEKSIGRHIALVVFYGLWPVSGFLMATLL